MLFATATTTITKFNLNTQSVPHCVKTAPLLSTTGLYDGVGAFANDIMSEPRVPLPALEQKSQHLRDKNSDAMGAILSGVD